MPIPIRACAVTGERTIEIKEINTPGLRHGEALIKVRAVALCTLEQRVFSGEMKPPLPFVGGHEVSGEVVALGEGADTTQWRAGARVVVRLLYNCGECYYCRTGHSNLCVRAQKKPVREGLLPGPGGLCDYLVANTSALFRIPDWLSYEEACLTEPLACCVHSVEKANIDFAQDVVVIGGGIMGQFHCLLSKRRGARVILSEVDESRRALALKLGVDMVINPSEQDVIAVVKSLTDGRGADVVFNTTAIPAVFAQAIELVGKTGRLVQYSSMHPDGPTSVSPQMLHSGEMILTGSISPDGTDFYKANRLISAGIIDVKPFIAGRFKFSDAQNGFEKAITPGTFRIVITD